MNNTILFLIFSICFISCDPTYNEYMRIQNESGKDLHFVLKFKNDSYTNHLKENNKGILFKSIPSTNEDVVLRATVPNDFIFYLHNDGGVGHINFENSETALSFLKIYCDTIFVENPLLKKDLYNLDLWNQEVEFKRYSSSAFFTFYIARGDVR